MTKMIMFISFDYENDKHYKNLLVAWDQNDLFDFEFYDESVSVAVNSDDAKYIRSVIRKKIEVADALLCIVGEETHKSGWCAWEIETAKGLKKGLLGVKTDPTNESPVELLGSGACWAMSFAFEEIKKAIESL